MINSKLSVMTPNKYTDQASEVLFIKESEGLFLKDVELGKVYFHKITLRNLMNFQIIITLRSSDVRKLDMKEKLIKLKANQTYCIEFRLLIEKRIDLKDMCLHIFFLSNLFNFKYPINIKFLDLNKTYNSNDTPKLKIIQTEENELNINHFSINNTDESLIFNKNTELRLRSPSRTLETEKVNDFLITQESKLIEQLKQENNNLKGKNETLMKKFVEFDSKLKSYSELITLDALSPLSTRKHSLPNNITSTSSFQFIQKKGLFDSPSKFKLDGINKESIKEYDSKIINVFDLAERLIELIKEKKDAPIEYSNEDSEHKLNLLIDYNIYLISSLKKLFYLKSNENKNLEDLKLNYPQKMEFLNLNEDFNYFSDQNIEDLKLLNKKLSLDNIIKDIEINNLLLIKNKYLEELKQSERPRAQEEGIRISENNMSDFFRLLSAKDNEILELKSKLFLQEEVINNLKNI